VHQDDGRENVPPVRIVTRPIGSPLPLGFFAFGVGTLLLTGLQLGWVPMEGTRTIAVMLVAFVGPLEVLAGIIAYLARDAGSATALGILGAAWIGTGSALLATTPAQTSAALGFFLLIIAGVLVLLLIPAIPGKAYLAVVLALAVVRFALTGVYEMDMASWAREASGWLGVPLAAASAYGGLALLLEDAQKQTILPFARRGAAERAIEGGPEEQIAHIETEAGVRNQL